MSSSGPSAAWTVDVGCMIVHRESLDVLPAAEDLLAEVGDDEQAERVDDGSVVWSHDLAGHLLRIGNVAPAATLGELVEPFERSVKKLTRLLGSRSARLLPGGMHPWMVPVDETHVWPRASGRVYREIDALFNCRTHGWANVSGVHFELPFADESEFGRLMAAVRLVLPLIPALAASSPVVEGERGAALDNRIAWWATRAAATPAVVGSLIPEPVYEFDRYRAEVLAPIQSELERAGGDPILFDHELSNARGAVARLDRSVIELTLIGGQECPFADLAVVAAVSGAIAGLVEERWSAFPDQARRSTEELRAQLDRCATSGSTAAIDPELAALFGADPVEVTTAGRLWEWLVEESFAGPVALEIHVANILRTGTLAERIARAVGPRPGHEVLVAVYQELAECLAAGRPFRA